MITLRRTIKFLPCFILTLLASFSANSSVMIEEWLEPVIEFKNLEGEWSLKSAKKLPQPPLIVKDEKGNLLLVNIRRVGMVWVPRTSVRLNEEALQLACQETSTVKAKDYKNFGMRGEDDNQFTCLAVTKQ
ncbi:hypothetical protein [Vibrio sp. 99-70-13A1]|uniref:hypothetical protein n=1 Tax=Vibrio sp. 99-70-13A1 TaxID=2607601 RepID=UPI0014936C69|nr:hypothetical protein [Vibrio sp. 99-70-13A1]NOH97520.1 hypothetical protein [Vibrio sp. 99-70-13A1]